MYETPAVWKSERWWRNRPVDERIYHARVPRRVERLHPEGQFIEDWTPVDTIVMGDAGYDKSLEAYHMLMAAMVNEQCSGRWIEADDYIEMLKDSFGSDDGNLPDMYSTPYLIKYIKSTFDVLVLDGLGEERKTDFAQHELGSLIRKRYDREKVTIITTTMTMSDIVARYGQRVGAVIADFELVKV